MFDIIESIKKEINNKDKFNKIAEEIYDKIRINDINVHVEEKNPMANSYNSWGSGINCSYSFTKNIKDNNILKIAKIIMSAQSNIDLLTHQLVSLAINGSEYSQNKKKIINNTAKLINKIIGTEDE